MEQTLPKWTRLRERVGILITTTSEHLSTIEILAIEMWTLRDVARTTRSL